MTAFEGRSRAAAKDATRTRIVDAALELHEAAGDLGTTVTEIARRAGVSRLTVYRHFPDERSLLAAAVGDYLRRHPAPAPAALLAIRDPHARLDEGLRAVYAWFAETERLIGRIEEDAPTNPALEAALVPLRTRWADLRAAIDAAWPRRSFVRRAAIGHAIAFPTWQSLCRAQGLETGQAIDLMMGTVRAAERAAG